MQSLNATALLAIHQLINQNFIRLTTLLCKQLLKVKHLLLFPIILLIQTFLLSFPHLPISLQTILNIVLNRTIHFDHSNWLIRLLDFSNTFNSDYTFQHYTFFNISCKLHCTKRMEFCKKSFVYFIVFTTFT